MKKESLSNFTNGWFIGKFTPSIAEEDFEVGLKHYKAGETNSAHYHMQADEITLVLSGSCLFYETLKGSSVHAVAGDIIKIARNEIVGFKALENCDLVVIKTRSVTADKYFFEKGIN